MSERTQSGPGFTAGRGLFSSVSAMRVVVSVLAVIAVAGLVLTGAFGLQVYHQRQQADARSAAIAAARTTCIDLMSVSAKTIDRDMRRTLAGSTGDFASQYKADEAQLKKATVENKVAATGTVLDAAVTTMKIDKSATVLLAMDAVIRNVNAPKGRKAHYRVRATLAYEHGTWLVSKVEFVG